MGGILSRIFLKKEMRVLMLGLDAVGKTTILYKLKLGKTAFTTPTVGFNVEKVIHDHVRFVVWDLGGQSHLRQFWRHYFPGTKAIIYVIDSTDRSRLYEAKLELFRVVTESEMENVAILIYANKQDMPEAMPPDQLQEYLELQRLKNRRWYLQPSCATTGAGLYEGLEWLTSL